MGQVYSSALFIPPDNFQTGQPLCEIDCTATDRVAITELYFDVFQNAAAGIVVGFGRPAAPGDNAKITWPFEAEDTGNSSDVFLSLHTLWSNPPTAPLVFARRASLNSAATSQGAILWRFDPGFILLPGASAVLWCITGGTTLGNIRGDLNVVVDG